MGNPLPKQLKSGTLGELLVQLRLLEHDVQAAPPLKDTGNDLVALKGREIKLVQVKTHDLSKWWRYKKLPKIYDILAVVRLERCNVTGALDFDRSEVYLWTKDEIDSDGMPNNKFDSEHTLKKMMSRVWGN
ncbi:MAG: hypothetical protein ABIK28_18400 [Planctomycetota bacterium]